MFKILICKAFVIHFYRTGRKLITYAELEKIFLDLGVKEWKNNDLDFTLNSLEFDLQLIRINKEGSIISTIQFLQIEEIFAIGGTSAK